MKISRVVLCLTILLALSASGCEANEKKHRWWVWGHKKHFPRIRIGKRGVTIVTTPPTPSPEGPMPPTIEVPVPPTPEVPVPPVDSVPPMDSVTPVGSVTPPPASPKVTGPMATTTTSTATSVEGDATATGVATATTTDGTGTEITETTATTETGTTGTMTSEFATATAGSGLDGTTTTETATSTSESTSTDVVTTATDTSATTTTEAEEECTSVANTAAATEALSTLTAAVTTAELLDALGADFGGTVFAPTNDAFEALFTALDMTAEEILADLDLLNSVLALHVVPDVAAMAADLTDGQELTTLGGEVVTVRVSDGVVTLTSPGGQVATVITPDIEACDAIVHVIDQVLTPAP